MLRTLPILLVLSTVACSHGAPPPRPPRQPPAPDGCVQGDADACNTLGLESARPPWPRIGKAVGYYRRGCDLGSAAACANMANMFEVGRVTGAPDLPRAHMLYARACGMDFAPACAEQERLRLQLEHTHTIQLR